MIFNQRYFNQFTPAQNTLNSKSTRTNNITQSTSQLIKSPQIKDNFVRSNRTLKTVSFGSTERVSNEIEHCCYFFRNDIDWKKLTDNIVDNFKKPPKIVFEACSDGSECYALALALINKLGKDAQKYFPIVARDFDKDIIKNNQKGIIGITEYEKLQMEGQFSNLNISNYFKKFDNKEYQLNNGRMHRYKINEELKNAVNFEVKDLKSSSKEKFDDEAVVFVRNVAHQMPTENFEEIIKNYSNNLKPKSLFITGNVENLQTSGLSELMDKCFRPVENANTTRFGDVLFKSVREQS